jgi:hypothetical protein
MGDYYWAVQPIFVDRQQYYEFNDSSTIAYLNANLK